MDYYDEYDYMLGDDVDDYDMHQMPADEQHTLPEIHNCIQSSATQILTYLLALLGTNLIYHMIWLWSTRRSALQHTASVLCGFALLYFATEYDFLIVVFLSLLAYVLMLVLEYFKHYNMGIIVATLTILSHLIYELLWQQPESWQRVRGIQMIATMKIISLAFDYEAYMCSKQLKAANDEDMRYRKHVKQITCLPSMIPFLGYVFCPANCVLGPWLSYAEYTRSLQMPSKSLCTRLFAAMLNAIVAVLFLCLSNCIVPHMCTNTAWIWLRTYRDALAVRCSHYFICFLSQATLAASGIAHTHTSKASSTKVGRFFGRTVTKPLHIELPRSLSEAVRAWNVPMHEWLKHYVFRSVHNRFNRNYLLAIFSTYLVSALLHGIHVRIYVVLLSLAAFAYVELLLRRKLAHIFDACIVAHACKRPCSFKHCPSHGWRSAGAIATALVNLCFALLTLLHLAYLGIMMSEENDDIMHAESRHLTKWLNLNYMSHWIALATYLFYLVV